MKNELICKRNYDNVRSINSERQKQIANIFLKEISKEIEKYESSENSTGKTPKESYYSDIDRDKFLISSLIYQFCFSQETAQTLLGDLDRKMIVSRALILSTWEKEKFVEIMLKGFLRRNNVNLQSISYQLYEYNSYEFFMQEYKVNINENTYFEILYHNISDVKDKDENELPVANYFIIHVEEAIPNSLFVIVTDPNISKLAIRKMLPSGISSKLTFVEDYDEAIKFLTEYVSK